MTSRPGWHEYFMALAKLVASRSTCNSRKTGAVIVRDHQVLSTGYNGAMSGAPHCSDCGEDYCYYDANEVSSKEKMMWCPAGHAEWNALANAARQGTSVSGGAVYTTLEPCPMCIKILARANILDIYYELPYESQDKRDDLWDRLYSYCGIKTREQILIGRDFFQEILEYPPSRRRLSQKGPDGHRRRLTQKSET
ncbi:MAG: dCMP deaminase family protein [Deltaproteobacteria bacterium]|nr:dCMP deaminase family protein [Deltaproteobacteria bacterium]